MSPANEAKLDASMKRLGCFKPIVVREVVEEGVTVLQILGGEHRAQSAVRSGIDVPIINLGAIDDKKAKEISLADNARYGDDDAIKLATMLKEMGDVEELQDFLPYTADDYASIFQAADIDLSELDIDENFEATAKGEEAAEPPLTKVPKTHTIMRFKVPVGDAERLTELIARCQTTFGYTAADQLTNAGDALVHLMLTSTEPELDD